MRIAQIAPLYESVPPQLYGGTERVVSYLTEALVADGHDVTLFASGDSLTSANLIPVCPRALRLDEACIDYLAYHVLLLEAATSRASEFDIMHFHIDYQHFPLSRRGCYPHLTTLHGRLDIADLVPIYREFSDMPLVSISDAQRRPLPWVNWQATVHHGLPLDLYDFHPGPGEYLAFLGRISPEKRVDRAIHIAQELGIPLRIAAKVDRVDWEYFREQIAPLLDSPLVEFVGEIGDREKAAFLGNARALLFPIDWPEPFGLSMIEALACGTPVVAYNHGSVPEILEHGKTGFIVDSLDSAITCVQRVGEIDRGDCRAAFEQRFTACRMARNYVDLFERFVHAPLDLLPVATANGIEHR